MTRRLESNPVKVILYVLLIGAIVSFLVVFFIKPFHENTEPCLYIKSLDIVSPLKVNYANPPSVPSSSSNLTGSWNVSFGYYNRNNVKISSYDYIDVAIYYGDTFLFNGTTTFVDIQQGKNQLWFNVSMMVDVSVMNIDDIAAYSLVRDINRGSALRFNLMVSTTARVPLLWLYRGWKSKLMYYVPEISIGPHPSEKLNCYSDKRCRRHTGRKFSECKYIYKHRGCDE